MQIQSLTPFLSSIHSAAFTARRFPMIRRLRAVPGASACSRVHHRNLFHAQYERLFLQQFPQSVVLTAGDEHLPPAMRLRTNSCRRGSSSLSTSSNSSTGYSPPRARFMDFPFRQLQERAAVRVCPWSRNAGRPGRQSSSEIILMRAGQAQPGSPLRLMMGLCLVLCQRQHGKSAAKDPMGPPRFSRSDTTEPAPPVPGALPSGRR